MVATNFTESNGTGAETMGLLDTTGGRGSGLASLLGRELFTRGLATSRFASGLLLVIVLAHDRIR